MNKPAAEARKAMVEKIINHSVQGEVYILSPGRVWKSLVLNHFNKVKRGELSVNELVIHLEKCGVKYAQKHHLVKYPVIECLMYISKVTKQSLLLPNDKGVEKSG